MRSSEKALRNDAGEDDQLAAAELLTAGFALLQARLAIKRPAVCRAALVIATRGFPLDLRIGAFEFGIKFSDLAGFAVVCQRDDRQVGDLHGTAQPLVLNVAQTCFGRQSRERSARQRGGFLGFGPQRETRYRQGASEGTAKDCDQKSDLAYVSVHSQCLSPPKV
jgi:hypothetical protein